jgi:hypothetical protein
MFPGLGVETEYIFLPAMLASYNFTRLRISSHCQLIAQFTFLVKQALPERNGMFICAGDFRDVLLFRSECFDFEYLDYSSHFIHD